MDNNIHPVRILVKTFILFFLCNFLFILCMPIISRLQVYNHLVSGRLRFAYAQPQLEQIAHSVSVYEEMDAMFGSHYISSVKEKPSDEFRVLFLGDSSIWGAGVPSQNALPGQINALHLMTCDKRRVTAYNLAFPSLYVMKDLLILQKAMEYNPDLIIWGVTLRSLADSDSNAALFLPPYSNQALYLIGKYDLNISTASLKPQTFWDRTLFSKRASLRKLTLLEADAMPWVATDIDYDIFHYSQIQIGNDVVTDSIYMGHGAQLDPDGLMLDVLDAGDKLAEGIPVLVLNEPVFIATGRNSDLYYNNYYPRPIYDQYLRIMSNWASDSSHPYYDAWDIVPASMFTNTPLHISASGEALLASRLEPIILQLACRR